MNQAYRDSMEAAVNQLVDEIAADADSIKGVIVSSGKKTFFAGGDLKLMTQATPADADGDLRERRVDQGHAAQARDARQARRRGHQRRRARRRPRDRARLPPPHRGGRRLRDRPARGHPRPAARRRRRHPHGPHVRHPGRADERAAPGPAHEAGRRPSRRASSTRSSPAGRAARAPRRRGSSRSRATRTRPRSRGTARATRSPAARRRTPKLAAVPAGVPVEPAQADQGRRLTRRRAGIMAAAVEGAQVDFDTASRIESRYLVELIIGQQFKNMTQAFFFDLRPINAGGSRPDGIEPQEVHQGRRARRRHDGRRHRVRLGQGRHGGRPQGRRPRRRREGQGVQREAPRQAAREGPHHAGEGRRVPRPHHAHRRLRRPRGLRPRRRGGVRVRRAQALGVRRARADRQAGRAARLQHVDAADHRAGRGRQASGRLHRHPLLLARSTRCRWSRSSPARRRTTRRSRSALDYVQQIKKIPIVVNDSRGFFTSRVIGHFINEGLAMLGRGRQPGRASSGRRRRPASRPACCRSATS